MNKEKIVLVIDRYEGDIRSTPKYLQMLRDNLPEGYELVTMSDTEIRGMTFDQVILDELNSIAIRPVDVIVDNYKTKRRTGPYWKKSRW